MSDTLKFRTATENDIATVAALVSHSFPGPARPAEAWDAQLRDPAYGGGLEVLLLGESGGRPVAFCELHPLKQWIAGTAIPSAGIGTVSILPSHRKRGLAAQLMVAALRAARERGDVGSALYPFRSAFYQKLGYGHAGESLQYQVKPEWLPDAPERRRIELCDQEPTRAEVLELYKAWIRTQTGQVERSATLWQHWTTRPDRSLIGYRGETGAIEGYALVTYRADLPPQHRFLEVTELVWTTIASRRGLYAWLGSLGDQWEQILLRTTPSQRFADWVGEARLPWGSAPGWELWFPSAVLLMGPMFRLVDLRTAWEGRRVHTVPPVTLRLEVTDGQLPENSGQWRFAIDSGRVSVERTGEVNATLRLEISTLSRLFVSALRPSAALAAGLLECDRPELLPLLDQALALPEPWIFDRF